jgi:hypothetical protein
VKTPTCAALIRLDRKKRTSNKDWESPGETNRCPRAPRAHG